MKKITLLAFILWLFALAPLLWWQWLLLVVWLIVVFYYQTKMPHEQHHRYPYQNLKKGSKKQRLLGCLALLLLACTLGWVVSKPPYQLPIYWQKTPLLISGRYELMAPSQSRVQLKVDQLRVASYPKTQAKSKWLPLLTTPQALSGKVHLTSYDKRQSAYFQKNPMGCLVAQVVFKKPHNFNNDNGFDYVQWSQRQGLLASGYIKTHIISYPGCQSPLVSLLANWRYELGQKIDAVPLDGVAKALWQGLILGNAKALTNQQWQILHRTGTTHLLVISGLHIGLVAGLVLLLCNGWLAFLGKPQWQPIGLILSALAALGYAVLSGWGVPAQRAMIMLLFVTVGQLKGVGWPLWQRLSFAMLFTVVIQPNSMYSMGFWFSYIAVFNIVLFWHFFQTSQSLIRHKVAITLYSQLGLMAVLVPVIAATTGGLSIIGPLLNLLLIPLFAMLIVPVLLVASLLLLWLPANTWVFVYVGKLLSILWDGIAWFALQPLGFINVTHWPVTVWLIWLSIGFVVLLFGRVSGVLLCALMLLLAQPKTKPQQQLTLLDVGQGLSIWVQSDQQHLLYDLGDAYASGFDLMSRVVLPTLRYHGVAKINKAYVSHWDRDHSGGLTTLANPYYGVPVKEWVLPSTEPPKALAHVVDGLLNKQACVPSAWQPFGHMRIRHLAPLPIASDTALALAKTTPKSAPRHKQPFSKKWLSSNNQSCVIQLEMYGVRILLAGDIETVVEQQLIQAYGEQLRSDILIAPHHGSKTSSSTLFLSYVKPRVVLISAGYLNRFKHPHAQVLQNYWNKDVVWYSTAIHGQITVRIAPDSTWQVAHR